MKRLILSSFSSLILVVSATAGTIVHAQTTAINSSTLRDNSANVSYLQPFNLVYLAYQGKLKQQGVPSGATLLSQYQVGSITEADLVKAAVNANRLPASVLTDKAYLNAVELQLSSLLEPSNN